MSKGKSKKPVAKQTAAKKPEGAELSEEQLDQVAGGALNAYIKVDGSPQGLNIGSQSSGAGAGKITFNPF
jgi:hypothetical protein